MILFATLLFAAGTAAAPLDLKGLHTPVARAVLDDAVPVMSALRGYFGAGIGIMMLAAESEVHPDIHQMNGLRTSSRSRSTDRHRLLVFNDRSCGERVAHAPRSSGPDGAGTAVAGTGRCSLRGGGVGLAMAWRCS